MTKLTKPTRGGARPGAGWKRAPDKIVLGRHVFARSGDEIKTETVNNDGEVIERRWGNVAIALTEAGIQIHITWLDGSVMKLSRETNRD